MARATKGLPSRDLLLIALGRLVERYPGCGVLVRRLPLRELTTYRLPCVCRSRAPVLYVEDSYAPAGAPAHVSCRWESFPVALDGDEYDYRAFVGQCEDCGQIYLLHDTDANIEWINSP